MNEPELRFRADDGREFPEWEEYKLGDLAEIRSAARVHRDEWQTSGVPFYRSSDVMAFLNGKDNEKAYISEELYEKLCQTSGKLQKGDILITGGGSIGTPYIVPNDDPLYTKDADLLWIKKNENLDPEFLYTYFFTPNYRKYLMSVSHIGTIAHYTIEQIKVTPITIPSVPEQQKIADLFFTLDNIIDSVQKEVDSWEQMKRGVMQKLFSQEVRFKADDGSEFPEWGKVKLSDVTYYSKDKIDTKDIMTEEYVSTDTMLQNFAGIKTSKTVPTSATLCSFQTGDILMADIRPYLKKIWLADMDGACNSDVLVIRPKNGINSRFIYDVLTQDSFITYVMSSAKGSKMPRGDKKLIMNYEIPEVCFEEQQKIADCLSEFDSEIEKTKQKLEAYKQLKKGLMQRMFV